MATRTAIDPKTGRVYYWHDQYANDRKEADKFLRHTGAKQSPDELEHVDKYTPEPDKPR